MIQEFPIIRLTPIVTREAPDCFNAFFNSSGELYPDEPRNKRLGNFNSPISK